MIVGLPLMLIVLFSFINAEDEKFEEVFGWKAVKFNNAPETECRTCLPAGIKVHSSGKMFVSFPRWTPLVTATLASIDTATAGTKSPSFIPWPSLEMNKEADYANALQSVLGFEIVGDKLYALDQGVLVKSGQVREMKGMKLMIFDIPSGKLLDKIDLTQYVDKDATFLNDLVIDINKNLTYLADSGNPANDNQSHKPKLLIINLSNKEVTVIKDQLGDSLKPDPTFWLNVNGEKVLEASPMKTGIDGIALSCDGSTLFYTPLSSRIIYSVSTSTLRSKDTSFNYTAHYKRTASDGLIATGRGFLYMTSIEDNSIYKTPVLSSYSEPMNFNKFTIFKGDKTHMWPDTLSIHNNTLYFISNQLNNFVQGKIDFGKPDVNFRLHKLVINDYSYSEGCSWLSFNSNIITLIIILFFVAIVLAILIFIFCRRKGLTDPTDHKTENFTN